MPSEILILLITAAAGIVGSIALMICNAVLGRHSAGQAQEEDYEPEETPLEADASDDSEGETVREIKFTPLDDEQAGAPAQETDGEPVTVAQLRLVRPEDGAERNSATVGSLCVSIGNAQDIGQRDQQQDAFAITPLEEERVVEKFGVMAVVCDGMGGMENGAEAAQMGAVQFMRAYLDAKEVDNHALVDAVYAANSAVYQAFQGKSGMMAGTTLVAASVLPDGLRFVSVGDSHIYLHRKGKLYQLNRDHNYFTELMDKVNAGEMTLEEAQHHPERAHLTSFVGIEKLEKVDYNIQPVALRPGDRILLCSDGLFKTLSVREIVDVMERSEPNRAQDALLEAVKAKSRRKQDNVTIVLLYCDGR